MTMLTPDTGLIVWQIALVAFVLFILGAVVKWAFRQYKR